MNNKSVTTYALVDTGADHCMFPRFLAEALGHSLKDPKAPVGGTLGIEGKKMPTWKHPFIIGLPQDSNRNVAVKEMQPALIECSENNNFPPILGTSNFLIHFNLAVLYKKKIVRLQY